MQTDKQTQTASRLFSIPDYPDATRFSPEFRLLAACSWIAPPALTEYQSEKIGSCLDRSIDWNEFGNLTERHRVQTLTCTALARHAADRIPDQTMRRLKERSTACRLQALQQTAELARLAKLFANHGIQVIPLKGVMLSERLYGDVAIRQARDLDILIRPDDLEQACQLLESEGFRTKPPRFSFTPRQRQSFIRNFHHYEFVNPAGMCVELHWSFYAWPADQVALAWERSQTAKLAGCTISRMDDDLLILMLCDHGAKHAWFRLKWLSDIAMLLSEGRPNGWRPVIELAEQLDLKRTLAQASLLVHWIYGVPLADELAACVAEDRHTAALCQPALEGLQKSAAELESFGRRMEGLQAVLQIWQRRPSLSWRTVLMPILTQPADYRDFPLPDWLFWLYIPLRPFFWLRRHYLK